MPHAEIDPGDHAHQQDHKRENRGQHLLPGSVAPAAKNKRAPADREHEQADGRLDGENHREEVPPAGLTPLPEQVHIDPDGVVAIEVAQAQDHLGQRQGNRHDGIPHAVQQRPAAQNAVDPWVRSVNRPERNQGESVRGPHEEEHHARCAGCLGTAVTKAASRQFAPASPEQTPRILSHNTPAETECSKTCTRLQTPSQIPTTTIARFPGCSSQRRN